MPEFFIPFAIPKGMTAPQLVIEKVGRPLSEIPQDKWSIKMGLAGYTIVVADDYEPPKPLVKFGDTPRALEL